VYKSILLMVAVLPAMASSIIVNGGFETNGGAGSSTFTGWTVTNESGSGGSWYVQTGTLSPLNGLPVPVPPEGSYAAMTDASGPSSQVLIQDFTVPLDATSVTLSFDYFLNNLGPDYVPGGDLDFNDSPNQQARVDILPSADGAFDTSSVLLNAYGTQSGDTLQPGAWETFSEDITSAVSPGGTYQLRFAEVDDLGQFNFGVDNVQINVNTGSVPEPSTVALSAAGLVLLGLRLRRKIA
jgi:hypothetical protein